MAKKNGHKNFIMKFRNTDPPLLFRKYSYKKKKMSVCLILSSSIPSRAPARVLTSYCPPSTGPCWALQHLWVGGTSIGVDYWPLLLHCLGPCWALPGSINLTATAAMAGAHSCLRGHIWPVVISAFVASQANVAITRFLWVRSSNTPYQ